MKKYLTLVLCILLIAGLSACGSSEPAGDDDTSSSQTATETGQDENSGEPKDSEAVDDSDRSGDEAAVDVDLTALSGTMVLSKVNDMMVYPDNYRGKTVKMSGQFNSFHDEEKDKYYFACLIKDATACCQQGFEFVLSDDYKYPDDYPKVDEDVTVVGTFDTYQEGKATYCTLVDAKLIR